MNTPPTIRPYKGKPPRHIVGFVLPSGKVRMEDGSLRRIRDLPSNAASNQMPGIRLYADHQTAIERFAMRGRGDVDMYNRKWIAWWPDDDHRVILLKDDPGNDDGVLAGLVIFRDFLSEAGASMGTVGHCTMSLLKATLSEPIHPGVGRDGPKAITAENMGGRQESYLPVGNYPSFVHLDLRAAYARTMAELFYDPAGQWFESSHKVIPETPTPVIARARVRFPPEGIWPGPLPRRQRGPIGDYETRDYPSDGKLTGTYEARELACAEQAGADVSIERVWVREYRRKHYPFAAWWKAIEQARALPGYAGHLGKMAGAALWGSFVANDDLFRVHYEDYHEDKWQRLRAAWLNRMYVGYDVGELVTARVRARLYRELIVPAGENLIGVHTDGGLLIEREPMPAIGGDWVPKYRGHLQYITPLAYRFKEPGATSWEYVMAGVKDRDCTRAFTEKWRAYRGRTANGHAGFMEITEPMLFRRLKRMVTSLEVEQAVKRRHRETRPIRRGPQAEEAPATQAALPGVR